MGIEIGDLQNKIRIISENLEKTNNELESIKTKHSKTLEAVNLIISNNKENLRQSFVSDLQNNVDEYMLQNIKPTINEVILKIENQTKLNIKNGNNLLSVFIKEITGLRINNAFLNSLIITKLKITPSEFKKLYSDYSSSEKVKEEKESITREFSIYKQYLIKKGKIIK